MTPRSYLRGFLRGFKQEERGSIAVEAVVILPMMFWTYLAIFSSFHAYRTYSVNQKAAYTIADMISRETDYIDYDYLNGTRSLMRYLTASDLNDVAIRVTLVKYDGNNDVYKRDWSKVKGSASAASNSEVSGWDDRLPILEHNERLIVVETYYDYNPPFDTGLATSNVNNFVFTRPRYADKISWQD